MLEWLPIYFNLKERSIRKEVIYMKKWFKKITAIVLTTAMAMSIGMPAFAEEDIIQDTPEIKSKLVITNPDNGEKWTWDVTDALKETSVSFFNVQDPAVSTAEVELNLKDYLAETYVITDSIEDTKESDIILKAGLIYNRDFDTTGSVSIYDVFGSTTNVGLYYAENRTVYWQNPGTRASGTYYPTSSTWNYSVPSNQGMYNYNFKPYTLLDCDVRVSGMTTSRTVELLCELDLT